MGYRSQVECCIYGDEKDATDFLLKEAKLINQVMEDWKEWPEALELKTKGNILTLSLDGVKWYESYEDIGRWNKLLIAASKEEYSLSWEFVRVGEESGDIEERSHGATEGKIYTSTSIECDY